MESDLKIGSKKEAMSKARLISVTGAFWKKIYKTVFFMILVGVIALSAYVWQKSLSGEGWSAEKKQEYLDSQNKSVILLEKDYQEALSNIESRGRGDEDDQQPMRDIFKAY
jgi:hypothetical protein